MQFPRSTVFDASLGGGLKGRERESERALSSGGEVRIKTMRFSLWWLTARPRPVGGKTGHIMEETRGDRRAPALTLSHSVNKL